MPIGAALGGILGDVAGVQAVFWTSMVLSVLCLPLLRRNVSDARIRTAEAQPEAVLHQA